MIVLSVSVCDTLPLSVIPKVFCFLFCIINKLYSRCDSLTINSSIVFVFK